MEELAYEEKLNIRRERTFYGQEMVSNSNTSRLLYINERNESFRIAQENIAKDIG